MIRQAAAVHYTLAIIEAATGREVRRLPRTHNLILDQGLDGIAIRTWVNAFTHAAAGTGTTPVRRDSGAVTLTRAADVVTASAGFFEAADVGRLLKFDTGEEMRVTAFTSATAVTVNATGAIAASAGTIWYVNQTALSAELKRTGTYALDSGDNGSTFLVDTWTHKRTFLFTPEVGTVNYREVGWSHTAIAGANLFGRDLLAGSGVTLVAGQQLKLVVELSVQYGPATAQNWTGDIPGWLASGEADECMERVASNTINANGTSSSGSEPTANPSTGGNIVLGSGSTALQAMSATVKGPAPDGSIIAVSPLATDSYVSGSFELIRRKTFTVSEGNSTAIRSIYLLADGGNGACYRVLTDAAKTKDSDHTLELVMRWSWGRILNN